MWRAARARPGPGCHAWTRCLASARNPIESRPQKSRNRRGVTSKYSVLLSCRSQRLKIFIVNLWLPRGLRHIAVDDTAAKQRNVPEA